MHKSVATIDSPEFINLQPVDLNPLMSSCEIKVLYIGENRNKTYIDKETATKMAKTLRGAPIVGYYKEDKEDFADHGEKIVIDDEGVKFQCMTRPYGFVAPDARVWFQKFDDEDDFGNIVTREYLMTNGFLWTGQFPECVGAVTGRGKPQSMELDKNSLQGKWAENSKTHMQFFIINDAIFSKLCILGEDVEPCFEGASVCPPSYTLIDNEFKNTLYSMMQDLKKLTFALQGGNSMEDMTNTAVSSEEPINIVQEGASTECYVTAETASPTVEPVVENVEPVPAQEFKKDEDEDKPEKDEPASEDEKKKEEDDEEKKKYTLLEEQYEELNSKYTQLLEIEQKYNELLKSHDELVAFKANVENAKKDELINSFYMLTDEDKADVIANKANYSLEDIESKLSVICVRKKVSFATEEKNEEKPAMVYNISECDDTPAWIKACENTQKNRK